MAGRAQARAADPRCAVPGKGRGRGQAAAAEVARHPDRRLGGGHAVVRERAGLCRVVQDAQPHQLCHPQRGGRRRSSTLPARRWHTSGYIAMFSTRQEKSITLKVLGAPVCIGGSRTRGLERAGTRPGTGTEVQRPDVEDSAQSSSGHGGLVLRNDWLPFGLSAGFMDWCHGGFFSSVDW